MLTNTSSQCPTLSTPCTVEKLSVNIKQQEKETRKATEKSSIKITQKHLQDILEFLTVAEKSG